MEDVTQRDQHSVSSSSDGTSACDLPPGVCRWRQPKLRDNLEGGPEDSNLKFVVRHDDFLIVLGPLPELETIVCEPMCHEGCLYYPDNNSILFTSVGEFKTKPRVPNKVKRLSLDTREVHSVLEDTDFANGMVLDLEGNLLICQQGSDLDSEEKPAYIEKLNLKTRATENVADNWYRRRFNGPNDVVVKSDGSIWFTDTDYPREQGFKEKTQMKNHVYRISPDGIVDVVADRFEKPNGLAFSPDESRLYVTDTGVYRGEPTMSDNRPHSITVFDVIGDRQLGNRRLFAAICAFDGSGLGTPDGIKVDTEGRVYVASTDGIHVIRSDGTVLGLIRVPHAVNMGFGGPNLDTLFILDDEAVRFIKLNVTGAGLSYAGKFLGLAYYREDEHLGDKDAKRKSPSNS